MSLSLNTARRCCCCQAGLIQAVGVDIGPFVTSESCSSSSDRQLLEVLDIRGGAVCGLGEYIGPRPGADASENN